MNAIISTDSPTGTDPPLTLILSYSRDRQDRRALAVLSRSSVAARRTLRCECKNCQTIDFMYTSTPLPIPPALLPSVFEMMFSSNHPWRTRGLVLDYVGGNNSIHDLAARALATLPRTSSAARRALGLCRCNACQTMEALRTSNILPPDALPILHELHFPPRFRIAILGEAEIELQIASTRKRQPNRRFLMDAYVKNGVLTQTSGAYRPPYTHWPPTHGGSFGVFPATMSTNRGPIRLEILRIENGYDRNGYDRNFESNHSEWLSSFRPDAVIVCFDGISRMSYNGARQQCISVHSVCGSIPIVVSGIGRDRLRTKRNVESFVRIARGRRQWKRNIFSVHEVEPVSGRNLDRPLLDVCKALLGDDGLQRVQQSA